MKIVDRQKFLAMPAGTLFSKYRPCVFGNLCIKGDSIETSSGVGDFFYQSIVDAIESASSADFFETLDEAEKNGTTVTMDFECLDRDGYFDHDQLFAVWEDGDVKALISRITRDSE